ncbi:MAG TPA: TonB-dependent receptor [Caulobacteraceae bacterium]|jgi:iron complex outermembrane receptor protein
MRRAKLLVAASGVTLAALQAGAALAQTPVPAHGREEEATVQGVVVTASPLAISADALISNVEVVGRDQLDVAAAQGLGDLLTGVPGLRSTFFGPGASRPVIRGLAGPRVLVLTNGVGQIDASALSPDHQVATDPAEARQIEVLRGPSALLYGGSAIGGVVNIIDDRIPATPAEDGLDGRFGAQLSSVDEGRQVSGAVKVGRGPLVFTADALWRESDDYTVPVPPESRRQAALEGEDPEPADRVENTAVELATYGAGLSYVTDRGFGGASLKRTETQYGVPGHGHHEEGAEGDEEEHGDVVIDLVQTRLDLRGEVDGDFGPFSRARGSVAFAEYEHTEFEGGEVGTRFESSGVEGRFELVQRERGDWSGALGVQALSRELSAIGEEAYVPSTEIGEAGLFTVQRWDYDAWGFEGGLRLDRRELTSDVASRGFTNWSASAGVFSRPAEGLFMGLSLSRNQRAPTEAELFAFGEHAATRAFEVGDVDLDSEVAWSVEAAMHYDRGRLDADLHLFAARYEGFIDLRPTGEETEEEVQIFGYRQTDANFRGVEAEASYTVWEEGLREVRVEGAFDYVRGDTDLGAPARIPPWSLTGRLAYETDALEGHLEVRHVAEQDRVAEFELPTDAYTLVNAFLSYRPAALKNVVIYVEGRNLGNVEAREHASFLKELAPLPGRNFRAGVAYRF